MLCYKSKRGLSCENGLVLQRETYATERSIFVGCIALQSTKSFAKPPRTGTMLLQEGDHLLLDGRGQTWQGRSEVRPSLAQRGFGGEEALGMNAQFCRRRREPTRT